MDLSKILPTTLNEQQTKADVQGYGLCQCGCGQRTTIAAYDYPNRNAKKGEPRRFVMGHNGRKKVVTDYRKTQLDDGRPIRVHRLRAERALGHPLPPKAVVHHADGSRSEHAQLVICENQAYHMFLHARMRVKAAGGDPSLDSVCGSCHAVKPLDDFHQNRNGAFGVSTMCRACTSISNRNCYLKKKASAA